VKTFVIDVKNCTGCYSCQIACKDEHCGNDWTPYSKPQPDAGHFWGKIIESERGSVPKVKVSWVFLPCQHCADAPCISICPEEAISRRDDGMIIINPKTCIGCRLCLYDDACPYGVIYFNNSLEIAQKCSGCAHLLDRGVSWAPRCVDACHNDALSFGEESEVDLSNTEILYPEYGTNPRVHYKNLPKRWIAGTVYDPVGKVIIKDATCTLSGGATPLTTTTDGFGDFWFEGLEVGTYSLKIEAGGKTKNYASLSTEEYDNLGDIALT